MINLSFSPIGYFVQITAVPLRMYQHRHRYTLYLCVHVCAMRVHINHCAHCARKQNFNTDSHNKNPQIHAEKKTLKELTREKLTMQMVRVCEVQSLESSLAVMQYMIFSKCALVSYIHLKNGKCKMDERYLRAYTYDEKKIIYNK